MDILITLRFLLLGLTAQYIGGFTPRFLLILVVIYFCSHSYNYKLFFSSSSFNLWTCADGVVISMIRITRTVEHSAAAQNYINLYPAFILLLISISLLAIKMSLPGPSWPQMGRLSGTAKLTVNQFR